MVNQLSNKYGLEREYIINSLPFILTEIREYTNQYFLTLKHTPISRVWNSKCYYKGNTEIKVGDTVEILNSENNTLVYTIKEVTDNYIELDQDIRDEDNSDMVVIKLSFQRISLKTIFSMINYSINFAETNGIKSQTLGGYNVTYSQADGGQTIFPLELYGGLNSLKKINDDFAEYRRKGYVRLL